jgi:hypothetical protein
MSRQPRGNAGPTEHLKTFLWTAILAALWCASPAGARQAPAHLQFSVQDRLDQFIPIGEVEFCRNGDSDCLYADIDRGFPGHFTLKANELVPGASYTVMIYTMNVQVIYEMRDWVYLPADYDPGWDKLLNCNKFLVFAQFRGDPRQRLAFRVDTTLNPVWEERAVTEMVISEADPTRFPALLFAAEGTTMLGGRFSEDVSAAGGVVSVSPGLLVSGTWRHGYPRRRDLAEGWIGCRELTVSYAQNRYETLEVMSPGRISDVTFQRLNISYGLARMSQSQVSHFGAAAVVSLGGIFDGSRRLEYLGRTYSLYGLGLQSHYRHMFLSGGGLEAGVVVEAGAVWYPVDTVEDDFWFGLAPSISLGVVVF